MAESRDSEMRWYSPDPRAIMPLDTFHVSRSLRRKLNKEPFVITRDACFERVIRECAKPRPYADETWINDEIIALFCELHDMGLAHSVEAWSRDSGEGNAKYNAADGQLVGGIYGLALGGAFFAESMFSRVTDGSKVCLTKLVEYLRDQGFTLLDVQFNNPHIDQFGVDEVPRDDYLQRLEHALQQRVEWEPDPAS